MFELKSALSAVGHTRKRKDSVNLAVIRAITQ
jgi:hypothetical protein